MSPLEKEIRRALGGPHSNADYLARYIGARNHPARKADEQSRLEYWGHSVVKQRDVAKAFASRGGATPETQWATWLRLWSESPIYDVKSIALIQLSAQRLRELRRSKWRDMVKMAAHIDNWAHSDTLSSMLAEALEEKPRLVTQYKKWNNSKNPWLRRQSLVGLYCYARMRKKHLPAKVALALVKARLEDPHFYVQRGVGWTLREIDRVDPKLQRNFVRENLNKISGVAWFATTELYDETLRKKLVDLRKKGRTTK